MKIFFKKTARAIVLTILPLALWSTNAYCISPQQIYVWVARQMNIEFVSSMPDVNYVGKERLQQVFQELSQKSYTKLVSDFGEAYALEVMGVYKDNIVGMFHPQSGAIYVGDFLDPCRQKAVMAHEFIHYFQDMMEGQIHPDDLRAGDRRTFREMEAYHAERKFEEIFCNGEESPNLLLALLY